MCIKYNGVLIVRSDHRQFWYGKIEGFGKYGGSKFGLSHWNDWSALQQCCATAQPVIYTLTHIPCTIIHILSTHMLVHSTIKLSAAQHDRRALLKAKYCPRVAVASSTHTENTQNPVWPWPLKYDLEIQEVAEVHMCMRNIINPNRGVARGGGGTSPHTAKDDKKNFTPFP